MGVARRRKAGAWESVVSFTAFSMEPIAVSAKASSFLSAEEIKNFDEFRGKALENNRLALAMNRKMMAPGAK